MVRSRKVAASCCVLLVGVVGGTAGCGASGSSQASTTSVAATLVPTTVVPTTPVTTTTLRPTTTTTFAPAAARPSPDDAAAGLVAAWANRDQRGAGALATPAAIATLFAIAYPAGELQGRGCTDPSVSPGTCTYRNLATDGIYEIGVTKTPSGWYVSSVTPET